MVEGDTTEDNGPSEDTNEGKWGLKTGAKCKNKNKEAHFSGGSLYTLG